MLTTPKSPEPRQTLRSPPAPLRGSSQQWRRGRCDGHPFFRSGESGSPQTDLREFVRRRQEAKLARHRVTQQEGDVEKSAAVLWIVCSFSIDDTRELLQSVRRCALHKVASDAPVRDEWWFDALCNAMQRHTLSPNAARPAHVVDAGPYHLSISLEDGQFVRRIGLEGYP